MPDLLLELFSEEIPARMQQKAAEDLARMMNERLLAAGFMPEGVKAFAGPRRLALIATGLPARQPDRQEEKKGPRVGAPEKAIEGFLKSAGLSSLDECAIESDKKGDYYVARIHEKGRDTAAIIAEATQAVIRDFPWPKSMRWGDGELRWVRPLQSILCCFADEIVDFDIGGVPAGDATHGHRRFSSAPIHARNFDKYVMALTGAKVMLDGAARSQMIDADAKTLCQAQGLELVADKGLLAEVAGLAEWPVVMMGAFDAKFLALPDEVLTASMRGHQKYFSVKDPKTGRLANKFIFVANIDAPANAPKDWGKSMRARYERVLTARLSDAWYLYRKDLQTPLDARVAELDRVTFFEGLRSIGDKAKRVAALAKEIAPSVGADPALAERAALLAKADLVTGMVYEFPELQGLMGRYYALAQGEDAAVADAIRDHYLPKGAGDDVPTAPVSVAVALADRIDTLNAFWRIGKKPTGSGDPFALRRAALGIIRIIIDNRIRQKLADYFDNWDYNQVGASIEERIETLRQDQFDLREFFTDRMAVFFRDRGFSYDSVRAAFPHPSDPFDGDLYRVFLKLEALDAFLKTDDGANLAAGFKRAANILKAEEKKGALPDAAAVKPALLQQPQEKALHAALTKASSDAANAAAAENFAEAMSALASLRGPIDAFFDEVTVNADDAPLRANRLALLQRFIAATAGVADLSKLEG